MTITLWIACAVFVVAFAIGWWEYTRSRAANNDEERQKKEIENTAFQFGAWMKEQLEQ